MKVREGAEETLRYRLISSTNSYFLLFFSSFPFILLPFSMYLYIVHVSEIDFFKCVHCTIMYRRVYMYRAVTGLYIQCTCTCSLMALLFPLYMYMYIYVYTLYLILAISSTV